MKDYRLHLAVAALAWVIPEVSPAADSDVVINEIHFHPGHVCEYEEFIELYNRGDQAVDLSNWFFAEGVVFTFPEGTIMLPGAYLVLAWDPDALAAAYGLSANDVFKYEGRLSNNGEDIVLFNALAEQVDRVRYDDRFPWPISSDGTGPSLELINPDQDNDKAGNWRPAGQLGPKWRFYSARGQAPDQLLAITLSGSGEFFLDDLSLKQVGFATELVTDGGFEDALSSNWSFLGNHSTSARVTDQAHTGTSCLKVRATGRGDDANAIVQFVSGVTLDGPEYELSFWALRITPGLRLRAGMAGGALAFTDSRDIGTVGASGSSSENSGVYTINASGADVWGDYDEFHYLYSSISGDGEIEALVTWDTAPNGWSKAGLMFRESTSPESAHAMCILSRDNGVCLQYRDTTGGSSYHIPGATLSGSARLRLIRSGDSLTGEAYSGGSWQSIGPVSIQMQSDILVGLMVTSHQDGQIATATFEDVLMNGAGGGLVASTGTSESTSDTMATPLAQNTQHGDDVPPYIHAIHAYVPTGDPDVPYTERITASDQVHLVALVEDVDPIAAVHVEYTTVAPGTYIRINDPAYHDNWVTVPMVDDGTGADAEADDSIYTALVPAQPNRTLVRYRLSATAGGLTTAVPYQDDEVPNFAYFVYDGVPDYVADIQSAHGQTPYVHRTEDLSTVPIYHLICDADDLLECEYKEIAFGDKTQRKLFKWQGTFVYDPMDGGERQVFDNVLFRLRGGVWRYEWPKRMYKVNLKRGHYLKAHYNDGVKFPEPRRMINIQSIIDQNWTNLRGISGITEAMAFWLFGQTGVAAPHTTWVHFRCITTPEEYIDQYNGDFKGLFLDIEQPDAGLLNTNYRPRGNLYKIDTGAIGQNGGRPGRWDKEVTDCTFFEDDADLEYFYDTYNSGAQSIAWWQQNLDLNYYYSYRAVLDSIRHYDIQAGKNYYYYHNSETGLWEVFPWDVDLILQGTCCGDTTYGENEPFWRPVIERYESPFGIAYRNRLREYLQLLGNREKIDPVIDHWRNLIIKLHEADRDRWDYFTVPDHPWTQTERTPYQGLYRSLDQRIQETRAALSSRLSFVWSNTSNFAGFDAAQIPNQPSIVLPATSPVELDPNDLIFVGSPFSDPDGNAQAAALWQATRVMENVIPPHGTNEFDPEWGERRTANFTTTQLPSDALVLGETYLVRVRYEDATGRMSLWSDPVEVLVADSGSQRPEAVITAAPLVGGAPLMVTFDGSASSDPDEDPLTFYWDFGDGETLEGQTVQHRYAALGTFTATLVVDDGRGRRDTDTAVVTVLDCTDSAAFDLHGDGQRGNLALDVRAGGDLTFVVETVLRQQNAESLEGIRGWSFGVSYHTSMLEVRQLDASQDLTGVLGLQPYVSTRIRPGGFTQAVLLSTLDLTSLPVSDWELRTARAEFALTASHDTPGEVLRTTVRFSESIGTPPVEILINRGLAGYRPCDLNSLALAVNVLPPDGEWFIRGDTNMDERVDISDPVATLIHLFRAGTVAPCLDAADANDDGTLDIADPIRVLGHLFGGEAPPPDPYGTPGLDPTDDALDCAQSLF